MAGKPYDPVIGQQNRTLDPTGAIDLVVDKIFFHFLRAVHPQRSEPVAGADVSNDQRERYAIEIEKRDRTVVGVQRVDSVGLHTN